MSGGVLSTDQVVAEVQKELDRARSALPEHWSRVALATTRDDRPSVRYVLLKHFDARGFVFYTHFASRKGHEMEGGGAAALAFHWWETGCQVRARGRVLPIPGPEADAYFAKRDRLKQLGAWASRQSRPPLSPLEERVDASRARFEGHEVPRPTHWGGYRLRPEAIEIWHDGDGRLHERTEFIRTDLGWRTRRLDP